MVHCSTSIPAAQGLARETPESPQSELDLLASNPIAYAHSAFTQACIGVSVRQRLSRALSKTLRELVFVNSERSDFSSTIEALAQNLQHGVCSPQSTLPKPRAKLHVCDDAAQELPSLIQY